MKSLKNLSVAIVTGGWTGERNENIAIARNIESTLLANRVKTKFVILDKTKDIFPQLKNLNVDFIFASITEEVPVQPIFESLGIPFNGSSNMTTSLSLNKKFVKLILESYGVTCPKDVVLDTSKKNRTIPFPLPYVVKPLRSGSSCGVSLARTKTQLAKGIDLAFKEDSKILVEEYIEGQEITIPVIGDFIMPGVKITSDSGIWDEERKNNLRVTLQAVGKNEKKLTALIEKTARSVQQVFELTSFWRLDTIYRNGKLYVLEINTQPCMAGGKAGVLPSSYGQLGWTHFDFLSHVAQEAMTRRKSPFKHVITSLT